VSLEKPTKGKRRIDEKQIDRPAEAGSSVSEHNNKQNNNSNYVRKKDR